MNDLESTDSDAKSNNEVVKASLGGPNKAGSQSEDRVTEESFGISNKIDIQNQDRIVAESLGTDKVSDGEAEEDIKIPWHFWLFVGLAGLYLVYRLIQMLIILFQHIF